MPRASLRRLALLAVLAAGCPTPRQYALQRSDLDCARAAKVTVRTLTELGYTVNELVEPSQARVGVVGGTKPGADGRPVRGRVRIVCNSKGVELWPIEDALVPNFEFSRGFRYSFITLEQRPDVETPRVEAGVQVLLEALGVVRARLDLGGEPTNGGAVPVRVTVRNSTDRQVAVAASGIELTAADGASHGALQGAALAAALAPGVAGDRVRSEQLERVVVNPQTTAVRFLVFPAGTYKDASVSVQDVETGESDGFSVPVQ